MPEKKVAVILSGSGVYDGAEIHEATLSLLAIAQNNAIYQIFAPDIQQFHVINHISGEEMPEKRNVLIESARIARGNIKSLSEIVVDDFDAILFPGGFGVAKNLCTLAFDGADCKLNAEIESLVKDFARKEKPIGALCIAPALIAKILGDVKVTIGQDEGTAKAIESMGGMHEKTNHGEIVIDEKYKVVTTPCYMLDANITQIYEGASKVVKQLLKMC